MGGMQTILALLSVVLFSSMTLNSYNNLLSQRDIMEASHLNIQAQEIVNRYFEKIECNMLSGDYDAAFVRNNMPIIIPNSLNVVNSQGGDDTYTFTRRTANYCNSDGSYSSSNTGMVAVQVALSGNSYGNRQVIAGTPANPLSAVFSEPN